MIAPRWRKVLRDIGVNKTRTVLVVLSVAVGVFAIGMVAGSNQILFRDLGESWLAASPSSATLFTQPFDDTLVEAVRKIPGVGWAEGRRIVNVRVKVGEEWKDLQLIAVKDFNDVRLNRFKPESGAYPPKDRELLVERASLNWVGAKPGDTLTIELPSKKLRPMPLVGVVHDITQPQTSFTGRGSAYVSFETLDWLGEPRDFDRLDFVVAEKPLDEAHIKDVLNQVTDKVERSGREVFFSRVPPPGEHPATPYVRPMVLLLGVLGVLALFLSGFLVINTISAVLKQQTRQIGVMKAIGGSRGAITVMYLFMGGFFGVMALVIGIPLGVLGAKAFTQFMASFINFDIIRFNIPPWVFGIQIVIGLVVPFLAALYPVIRGTGITVREAIADYGIADSGLRIADSKDKAAKRPFSNIQSAINNRQYPAGTMSAILSRPQLIALRNAFRRRGRVALTVITLILAGATFMAVLSLRASLDRTFDEAFKIENYDVEVTFDRPYRIERIQEEAMAVPGVVTAETWGSAAGRRKRADGTFGDNIRIAAPPAGTVMITPQLLEGRWLLPDDQNALVVNSEVLQNEKDLKVGDQVTLRIGGRENDWTIVGVTKGLFAQATAYTNYDYFSRVIRDVDQAGSVRVQTRLHSAAFQNDVARALEGHYDGIGMKVSSVSSIADVRSRAATGAQILVVFMVIMALLLAFVGGLGLMGTLSLNTLERTREIGVIRAIGASNGAVRSIVLLEGLVIGLASWAIAALVAYPFSWFLNDAVGKAFGGVAFSFSFSLVGVVMWLALIAVLSVVASLLPAWNASRLTVREVLAYE
jgi:putative ABC transport system permease protein